MIKYDSPPPNICTSILKVTFFLLSPSVSTHIIIGGCENEEMELEPQWVIEKITC